MILSMYYNVCDLVGCLFSSDPHGIRCDYTLVCHVFYCYMITEDPHSRLSDLPAHLKDYKCGHVPWFFTCYKNKLDRKSANPGPVQSLWGRRCGKHPEMSRTSVRHPPKRIQFGGCCWRCSNRCFLLRILVYVCTIFSKTYQKHPTRNFLTACTWPYFGYNTIFGLSVYCKVRFCPSTNCVWGRKPCTVWETRGNKIKKTSKQCRILMHDFFFWERG